MDTRSSVYPDLLLESDICKPFLDSTFDEEKYITTVIEAQTIVPVLAELKKSLHALDIELKHQVFTNHDDLLQQATGVQKLEDVLAMIHVRVESLRTSMDRLENRIQEPYLRIQSQIKQLTHIHETCEILRNVIRFMQLTSRLEDQLKGGDQELAKGAQSISELEEISLHDVTGINIIETQRQWIQKEKKEISRKSDEIFIDGLKSFNHTDISSALQIFDNLGHLKESVHNVVKNIELSTLNLILQLTQSNHNPQTFWNTLEALFNEIHKNYAKIFHLEVVLHKKRFYQTDITYASVVLKDPNQTFVKLFWDKILKVLLETIGELTEQKPNLRMKFENDYPQMLRCFNNLKDRIVSVNNNARNLVFPVLFRYESVYLSKENSRITDSVEVLFAAFQRGSTSNELSSLHRLLISDLQSATLDTELLQRVSRNVAKGIRLCLSKCQTMMIKDSEGYKIRNSPSNAQLRNVEAINLLHNLRVSLLNSVERVPNLAGRSREALINALEDIKLAIDDSLERQFQATLYLIEVSISKMFEEDYGRTTKSWYESSQTVYVTDLTAKIEHYESTYLNRFDLSLISPWREKICVHSLMAFASNISLIRPLSENGKMRIVDDISKFEAALSPIYSPSGKKLSEFGTSYKAIRALKLLLFAEINQIENDPRLSCISTIDILHHLYSRAPSAMLSPHVRRNWSLLSYYNWMTEHSTKDVLNVIQENLAAYAREVTERGETEFAPVYPIMLSIIEKERKNL